MFSMLKALLALCFTAPFVSPGAAFVDSSGPAIVQVTSAGGGASVIIGDNFDKSAQVLVWAPEDQADPQKTADKLPEIQPAPATPPKSANVVTPDQVPDPQALYVNLPSTPAYVWVKTAAGVSAPKLINRPEIWLTSDDNPDAGDRLGLFGRNLAPNQYHINPAVFLRNVKTGKVINAQVGVLSGQQWMNVDDHEVDIRLPKNLDAGAYEIYLHPGFGGDAGWSLPYRINVAVSRSLTAAMCRPDESSVIDPYKIFHAQGASVDGVHDDSSIIQGAIDSAAAAGGGLVLLPPGQFAITQTLWIRPGVILRGSGRGATSIVVWPESPLVEKSGNLWDGMDLNPMIWMETQAGVQDVTLVGGPGARCAIFVCTRDKASGWLSKGLSNDISIVRTDVETSQTPGNFTGRFEDDNFGVAVRSSTRNLTVYQCKITCSGPLIVLSSQPENYDMHIIGNTFTVYPRHNSDNVNYGSVSHSIIADNDLIGGARALGSGSGISNTWIFNNTISDVGNRGNAEEMLMSEYGESLWRGKCLKAGPDTVTGDGAKWKADQFINTVDKGYVFIEAGKGFGQFRRVLANASDTLQVDSAWDVLPDTSSRFIVVPVNYHDLYVDNTVVDSDGRCEFAYGSLVDSVVQGTRTRSCEGLSTTAIHWEKDDQGNPRGSVVAYNDYSWNRMMSMGGIHIQDTGGDSSVRGSLIGNRIFDNFIFDFRQFPMNQYAPVWDIPQTRAWPDMKMGVDDTAISVTRGSFNVINDNYISHGPVGIRIEGGVDNMVKSNVIDGVATLLVDHGANTFSDIAAAH